MGCMPPTPSRGFCTFILSESKKRDLNEAASARQAVGYSKVKVIKLDCVRRYRTYAPEPRLVMENDSDGQPENGSLLTSLISRPDVAAPRTTASRSGCGVPEFKGTSTAENFNPSELCAPTHYVLIVPSFGSWAETVKSLKGIGS